MGIGMALPGSLVEIAYRNEGGNVTRRRIRIVRSYDARNGNTYLRAWCFLRGEERTFRADRIMEWTDLKLRPVQPEPQTVVPPSSPCVAYDSSPTAPPQATTANARLQITSPRPAAKPRGRSRIGSGIAAAVVAAFVRVLIGGIGSPASPPAPVYTFPTSAVVATVTPNAVSKKVVTKKAAPPDTAPNRAAAFELATGVHSALLEQIYASADSNGNSRLSWEELAAFQRAATSRFEYVSNEMVLQPDEFITQGGGDCDDWAELTCGLLRYWGWDPYVGCFESPLKKVGHAVCLVRVTEVPAGFKYYSAAETMALRGSSASGGRYIPVDYDVVGGTSRAMSRGWRLAGIYVPELIYGDAM